MRIIVDNWKMKLWSKLFVHEGEVRDVSDRQRNGFKLFAYNRWFAHDEWRCERSFTFHLFDQKQIQAVAQFRMGAHWLNTECMNRSVPRSNRICACCVHRVREDEMHVMECPCYADIRERYSQVCLGNSSDNSIITDHKMWNMMNGDCDNIFWERFSNFILKCRERRTISIA
jgi:hypothetical protein